ncbi:acyl-CoA dehydrogenase family protein [Saccharopolyspora spinosa]|uniref:Acyl-CoA oxidase n=1 Tax=Saccharopolyspora spinosa TaxID=60894 RepID=A0A2N3XXZ9_SACSN|nr:acyl-CoA dehydrogenase family protein [Saccharopolyspora spinosa]PKW15555.1 acyl-CoA oxidase [Saccharopolyspora spinosa]
MTALDVEQDASAYRRTMRDLLRQELFDPRLRDDLSLREYMDLTIDRMKAIFREGLVDNDMWMGQSREHAFRSMCEVMGLTGAFDFALTSTITDHLIAGSALFNHGTPEQVARYHDEITRMHQVYAFCCTEIGGGTNLREIRTTVSWNRAEQSLTLDTPTDAACKFWIGNIKHAATVGMVLARLVIDGEDVGHHWFRVPLRSEENGPPLPGITILSCDPKGGIQANQVGGARFTGVRLPREALMGRYSRIDAGGRFSSTLPDVGARFVKSIETFVQERIFPLSAGARAAELAAHLTWRFAGHRETRSTPTRRVLLDEPLFLDRLYPVQLRCLALRLLERAVVRGVERDWHTDSGRKNMHLLTATGKCGSWLVLDVLAACREMCGSQGFHCHNQIVTLRTDFEVNVTFAGDNSVMAYQVARTALRSDRFASRPPGTLPERVEKELTETWRSRPGGSFTHAEAVTLVHARMLDLILSEYDADPQVPQQIMDDLVADFAAHRLQEPHRPVSADREKTGLLAELLAPLPELVTAPMVDDGYLTELTSPARAVGIPLPAQRAVGTPLPAHGAAGIPLPAQGR